MLFLFSFSLISGYTNTLALQYININGKLTAADNNLIPVDNGAFRYGYGLFETILVQNGSLQLADLHMERLFSGLQQLLLNTPALLTPARLTEQVLKTVGKNNLEEACRVRLQFYAGGGGYYGNNVAQTGYIIECFPLTETLTGHNENGLVLGVATGVKKSVDSLSNLKSCNALIYAMAARQAKANHWNDALITNTNDHIIETTIANVFWVKDGNIFTPPLADGCIAGIMRRHIMQVLGNVTEQTLTHDILDEADEVFTTNAVKRIKWVKRIGNTTYANDTIRNIYNKCF